MILDSTMSRLENNSSKKILINLNTHDCLVSISDSYHIDIAELAKYKNVLYVALIHKQDSSRLKYYNIFKKTKNISIFSSNR
jgi:hypothetical protein